MATAESEATTDRETRYIVGVDGSASSIAGLRWALERAADNGAHVIAVSMWQFPAIGIERPSTGQRLHAETQAILDDAIAEAQSSIQSSQSVESLVFQYPAADRLIDLSRKAELLVVGRRAEHGLGSLGSVSGRVAAHAHCPVVVVPPSDGASDEPIS